MSTQGFFTATPFQIPEQFRAFAENGVNQARDGYQKLKAAAESNNEALEAVYASAAKGASGFTAKLVDIAQANVTSSFDFAQSLVGVSSLSQAAELMSAHARKQFETLTVQSKELAELGQKVATETVEPFKASVTKAFQSVA
ncbi:MAG: phasin [Afipia felis]|nr:phasin [Afipia felis]